MQFFLFSPTYSERFCDRVRPDPGVGKIDALAPEDAGREDEVLDPDVVDRLAATDVEEREMRTRFADESHRTVVDVGAIGAKGDEAQVSERVAKVFRGQ